MKTNQTEVKNPEKKYLEIVNEYFKRGLTEIGFKLISKIENKDTRRKVIAAVTASFIGLSNVPAVNAVTSELPNTSSITTTNTLTASRGIIYPENKTGFVTAFPDVVSNHWAKEYIYKLTYAKIVNGYPDGTFAPDKTITRAEFAKMLIAPLKFDLNSTTSSFSDVASTNWASKYIEAAKANGLLYDDGTNKFNPNVPITREYVAFMMGKAIEMSVDEVKPPIHLHFSDTAKIDKAFQDALSTTIVHGVINGYPDGTFGPKKNITRAEASKIMTMGLEIIVDATLAMPKIEQPAMEWVAEDPKGTTEKRPCDGVTRRLVKKEKHRVETYLPLRGDEEWSINSTDRLPDGEFQTLDEAIERGIVIEKSGYFVDDIGQTVKAYSYKYTSRVKIDYVYYYEVYKPVARISQSNTTETYTGENKEKNKKYTKRYLETEKKA